MCKKLLLLLSICAISTLANSEPTSTNFMLMNNYNLRQSQNIWDRMQQGFQLNYEETKLVKYYEKFYTKNPATFDKLMKNATPYLYYMLTQTERYALPSELALIPIVESNYDPLAKNPTDAYAGMWQFVPITGTRFNLAQNNDIDERRNIVKSTNAALIYLNYLHLMFKQWDVAIGAYNWGEGGMSKAIYASNQKVGNVQYNELQLRKITAAYVPKIIALANIIRNPEKFGIKLSNIPNQPYFAITHPVNNTKIQDIIEQSSVSTYNFNILNPQFKNSNYTLNNNMQILLPVQQNITYLALNNTNLDTNTNTTVQSSSNKPLSYNDAAVIAANDTNNNDPINSIGYADNQATNNNSDAINTLVSQAEAENVAINQDQNLIKASNVTMDDNSKPILIVARLPNEQSNTHKQQLNNLVDNLDENNNANHHTKNVAHSLTITKKHVHYKVNHGDTLYSIAKKFDVSVHELRKDNKIKGSNVKYGQILKIKTYPYNVKDA